MHKAHEFASKVRLRITATVHNTADGDNFTAVRSNDPDRFLDLCPARYDVLHYNYALVWGYGKPATQDQFTILFFGKNMAFPQVASDFLANYNPSHRWGNDAITIEGLEELSKLSADPFRQLGMLQHERTLKVLPAMQARTQDEMPVKECAGLLEYI